jgi:hypothetical protein
MGGGGVANVNDRNRVGFFITLFCVGAFGFGLKKDTLEIQRQKKVLKRQKENEGGGWTVGR